MMFAVGLTDVRKIFSLLSQRKEGHLTSSAGFNQVGYKKIIQPYALLFIGVLVVTALASKGVMAATDSAASGAVIEEVVVTALRREQSLQDSPVSISAITGENLEKMGAKSFIQYARSIPSLSFIDTGPGQTQIVIRGIATEQVRQDFPKVKESVGVYIDEVPVSTARNALDPNLFDIERVEVLRGPQGTLYGSGSLAGTVRVITNKPNPDAFDANVSATIASQDEGDENYSVDGMVNIPVVEGQSALRIVGYHNKTSGFIDNVALSDENADQATSWGVRVAYSHQFTDKFGALAKVFYQELDTDALPYETRGNSIPTDPRFDVGEFEKYSSVNGGVKDEFAIYNLEFTYDFEWASLLSSTSYLDRQHKDRQDATYFNERFFGLQVPQLWTDLSDIESFAQEFRLTSAGDGRLSWNFGVYYNDLDKYALGDFVSPGFDDATGLPSSLFGAPPDTTIQFIVDSEEEQFAVYGEFDYAITDRWTATVGARWFDVTLDTSTDANGIYNGGVSAFTGQADESDTHFKFNVSYQATNDAMLYATASQGFRLGGTNDPVPEGPCGDDLAELGLSATPPSYDSETAWNYELGAKTSWLDQRLTVNATAYQIDWENIQAQRLLSTCGFFFVENGGKAQSRGVELELVSRPTPNLELSLSGSHTDAELTADFEALGVPDGTSLPFSPEWSGYGAVTYHFPQRGEFAYYVRADASYTGSRWNLLDHQSSGAKKLSSYTLANARVGLEAEKWRAELFVTNLNNERTDLFFLNRNYGSSQEARVFLNRPRAIGLTVSARM
tara:strand:+ start:1618 stop:3981 length:2364 start_codon:yes stop_codon:yes gene_type:complete